ncbi:hypothetical protein EJ08DRAFT_729096 [Tothia fuscella]|uniref:DNA replication checkpoint mediator MRC1 domain-containing protein n=1 Tax=Tothia fuscella TaxID=1048955 RepID=A0A9P4U385_9PEZI|nr:hypothetical protein EJ08DRAFT_729096 [Tothia fuscella]
MSTPSTPSRASASPRSNPFPTNTESPMELTPRSKVRAMLAALDDDSDDEHTARPIQTEATTSISPSHVDNGVKNAVSIYEEVELEYSDGENVIAEASDVESVQFGDNKGSASSAYARMKQQLLSKSKPIQNATTPFVESGSDSDHEPVQTKRVVRKRLSRPVQQKSKSPSPISTRSPVPLSTRSREATPSLFVSPRASQSPSQQAQRPDLSPNTDSDSDPMPDASTNSRLKQLVAKKRAERKAQREEERKKNNAAQKARAEKQVQMQNNFNKIYSDDVEDDADEEGSAALTQQQKPTRKASRKALEEMSRETQRMARNQQLAHEAKTKKKFTTKDLFRVFNFRQENATTETNSEDEHVRSGALASSDIEGHTGKDTPPTSPPSQEDFSDHFKLPSAENEEDYIIRTGIDHESADEDLPSIGQLLTQPMKKLDKGKGPAKEPEKPVESTNIDKGKDSARETNIPTFPPLPQIQKPAVGLRKFRVIPPPKLDADSDDDELEIISKSTRFPVFDQLSAKQTSGAQSFHALRTLAHLNSSERAPPKGRTSLSMGELQIQLQERARKQAMLEKKEKLDDLRARGIIVKTEEEREQDQLALESLLDRARTDAQSLAKKEKDAGKKDGNGEESRDILSDDEDDEDWAEKGDDEGEADVELSGSEEEDPEVEEELDDEDETGALFDNEAGEDEDEARSEDEEAGVDHDNDVEMNLLPAEQDEEDNSIGPSRTMAKPRTRNVIVDDEDEDSNEPASIEQPSQDDTMAAFGFHLPKLGDSGLTQVFKGTMAAEDSPSQEQDSLAFLRALPTSPIPGLDFGMTQESPIVRDSQADEETQFSLGLSTFPSQPQAMIDPSPSKFSEVPEPTQDVGFDISMERRQDPQSTVDTVMAAIAESPLIKKKGKLRRRTDAIAILSDEEYESGDEEAPAGDGDFHLTANAFDALFKAAKKPAQPEVFDKQRSDAKKMVEEQAEESEDEYAGLGGASDDENEAEMEEELKEMIDEGHVHVDEGEQARFYADKERVDDEKRIDKLYKDITTGMLRRKRGGADLDDLSDSDDEAQERRRRKQREFAKMRKALLADENIGKIAENPKKQAFLRAIEDREDDEDYDLLYELDDQADSVPDSQDTPMEDAGNCSNNVSQAVVLANPLNPLKRKSTHDGEHGGKENVPPMAHRRRAADERIKRPATLAEIREAVSFLIDEPLVPDSQVSGSDAGSDEEYDEDERAQAIGFRRESSSTSILGNAKSSVVNRLSIVRTHEEQTILGPQAFHSAASNSLSNFKVPSLLRRATTNLSTTSTTSNSSTTPSGDGIRRGGSKKSNIHYQAREAERKKIVEASERRRKEQVKKSVIGKGRRSVLGALGSKGMGFE